MHLNLHKIMVFRLSLRAILDVLFPPVCTLCGDPVEQEGMLCSSCFSALHRTQQATLRDNITEDFFADMPQVIQAGAFLFYQKQSPEAHLLYRSKYGSNARPQIAYFLAKQAAQEWLDSGFWDDIDVIIPVPLHRRRFRQRGFNQSEWIARALSEVTHIPMDTTHVTRIINNPHQASMSGQRRQQNVADIFTVNHPEELYRKHILLVDDVMTTGSTFRSCLTAMKAFRGCHFTIFALAKAH